MAREPLLNIPGGRPLEARLGDPLSAFQEPAAPAAARQAGEPPAPPGERHARHYVDIPAEPGT